MASVVEQTAQVLSDKTAPSKRRRAELTLGRAVVELLSKVDDETVSDRRELLEALGTVVWTELESDRTERLIDEMLPRRWWGAPSDEGLNHAHRNALARTEFVETHDMWASDDIADLNHSEAKNRAALAAKWRAEGRIFGVGYAGQLLHPVWQFQWDHKPKPIVAELLSVLTPHLKGWEVAMWFDTPNGWLDGEGPLHLDRRRPRRGPRRRSIRGSTPGVLIWRFLTPPPLSIRTSTSLSRSGSGGSITSTAD